MLNLHLVFGVPLHVAASFGHTESVKMILDCLTADQQIQLMSVQDCHGRTAIQCAERRGHTDIVRVLREYQHRAENMMREEYHKFIVQYLHVSGCVRFGNL